MYIDFNALNVNVYIFIIPVTHLAVTSTIMGIFLCQSVLSININLPIRKLLVLINQSFCGYLIDAKQM